MLHLPVSLILGCHRPPVYHRRVGTGFYNILVGRPSLLALYGASFFNLGRSLTYFAYVAWVA